MNTLDSSSLTHGAEVPGTAAPPDWRKLRWRGKKRPQRASLLTALAQPARPYSPRQSAPWRMPLTNNLQRTQQHLTICNPARVNLQQKVPSL